DRVVSYLEEYARHHELDVRLAAPVRRIERDGERWLVRADGLDLRAEQVVVATGYSRVPFVPDWPGRDGFGGELLHSSRYRNATSFHGRDVLVVGTGNSGSEIAVDLAEGGAERVRLAVRAPPQIVRRASFGI